MSSQKCTTYCITNCSTLLFTAFASCRISHSIFILLSSNAQFFHMEKVVLHYLPVSDSEDDIMMGVLVSLRFDSLTNTTSGDSERDEDADELSRWQVNTWSILPVKAQPCLCWFN